MEKDVKPLSKQHSGNIPAQRPGGRTSEVSRRVHDATIDLLLEGGFQAVTFQEVAKRAEVGRATIYRRWETPARLIDDAVYARASGAIRVQDLGSLRADLQSLLQQVGAFISSNVGKAAIVAGLSTYRHDDARETPSYWERRKADIAPVFERARQRGDIPADWDDTISFAALAGALYFRVIAMDKAVTSDWISHVLDEMKIK